MLLSTVIGVGVPYLYVRTIGRTYTGTARLFVENPYPHPHASDQPSDVLVYSNILQQQAAILTSRVIVQQALQDPNVVRIGASQAGSRLRDVVRTLSATVGRDDIINVSASSQDPNMAAVIVNAVARAYCRYSRWQESNRQDMTRTLCVRLETTMAALWKKRQEMGDFERRNPAVLEYARGTPMSKTLDDLKGQLTAASLRVIEWNSYCAALRMLESDPNGCRRYVLRHELSLDDSEWELFGEALTGIRAELAAAEPNGGSQIASRQETGSHIVRRTVESDKEAVRRHIALAETLCEDATAREQKLARSCEDELAKLPDATALAARRELLRAECDMLEGRCKSLLEKMSGLDLRRLSARIHVLEWATPGVASSLQMRNILLLGLAFGLIVGAGLSLVWEWIGPTPSGGRPA
ncbi:MAG: hypothetical protein KBE65_08010 [Phycisphaerae bacterium]|nr:hypothetical protein [Phycisphaerae bacterium]